MAFIKLVIQKAVEGFLEDDCWALASHIALSILTSLFPFLIFVTALAGFIGAKNLADEAQTLLFEAWPPQVAQPIATEVHNVLTQSRGDLLTLSAILALYFSSSAIEALRVGLNRAYDVREPRPWWLLRLESIAYVLVGAVALLLLALLVVFAPLVFVAVDRFVPSLASVWEPLAALGFPITFVALALALMIAHKWIPAGRRRMLEIAPGVILTIVLSIGFAFAFGQYLAEFARNYVSTYAGLASVMIAIVFLYSLACIFLFGGEFNAAIGKARSQMTADRGVV